MGEAGRAPVLEPVRGRVRRRPSVSASEPRAWVRRVARRHVSWLRLKTAELVASGWFGFIATLAILGNTVVLCTDKYPINA